jgi:NAD(P)-dependent dehydrogenase (short-subunit alcohol dehydrogenase family)
MLITGATSAIGRNLAEMTVRERAQVALSAPGGPGLAALCQTLNRQGATTLAIDADLTNSSSRQRLLASVVEEFGGLDILINTFELVSYGSFARSSEHAMRQAMEESFFAPAELIRLAIPILTEGRQPAIVNTASLCGRRGLPGWAEYSASLFALCGLTEALRGEMARFDIDVLLVLPGTVRPETAAERILHALKRNKSETSLGGDARWILPANRFFPGFVDRVMKRRARRLTADERR